MSERAGNSETLGKVDAGFLETGELQNNEDETLEDSHDSFIILETADAQINDNETLKEMAKIYADNLLYSSKEDIDSSLVVSEDMRTQIDSSFVTTKDGCIDKKVDEITDSIGAKDLGAHSDQLSSAVEEHTNSDKMCTEVDSCIVKPEDGRNKEPETQTEVTESFSGNHEAPELSSTRKQTLPEILQQEKNLVGQEDIGERVHQTDLKHDQQAAGGSDVKPVKTAEGQTTGFQEHVKKKSRRRRKQPTDFDLLLIGKTGNGKSATGNSILRRKAFSSTTSTTSVTKIAATEVSEFNGRVIKVVDSPGVGDNSVSKEAAYRLVLDAIEKAIAANPRGYHAFLLVIKYGGRFTEEDQHTIVFLKKVFGDSFVRKYCILVMTCGDNFESDNGDGACKTFDDWCDEQTGVFKTLLTECEERIILFDNKTKDEREKCEQIEELLKMVDELKERNHRYTDENFNIARETRERIIIDARLPVITEEAMVKMSLVIQKIHELQLQDDMEKKIQPLENLLVQAESLHVSICSQDRGTGALKDLCETAKSIKHRVNEEIRFCYRMMQERKRIEKQEDENRKMFKQQIQEESGRWTRQIAEEKLEKQKRELQEQLAKEKAKHKEETEKLEKQYREAKTRREEGLFTKLTEAISWHFRKITNLFSS